MIFWSIFLGSCVFFFIFHLLTRKYLNPYKLYLIFGKKGSGKSTSAAVWAHKYNKQGRFVFSNLALPNVFHIEPSDVGKYSFPEGSVIIIDEAGMVYDNRKFKSFPDYVRDWYKLQRHRHLIVYLLSQDFDIDLKLRQLTDEMWLTRKFFRVFTVSRRIDRSIVLHKSTADAPSGLADDLTFVPFYYPNAVKFLFIPRWVKMFDSFDAPQLPACEYYMYGTGESLSSFSSRRDALYTRRRGRASSFFQRLWFSVTRFLRRLLVRRRAINRDIDRTLR